MSASDAAPWVTLILTLAGFAWQYVRENRQRRWDKEDRLEVAAQRLATAKELAAKVEATGAELTNQIAGASSKISSEIAVNTQYNVEAIVTANNVNEKIVKLALEKNAIDRRKR